MHRLLSFTLFSVALTGAASGAAKPHVISFGKWTTIKWCAGASEARCLDLKVRVLYVDGRARESTLSASHEITDRLFVVRRAFRVNDNLPGDAAAHALPEFDLYYSVIILWPAGIATMPHIAASPTTARDASPWCSR